MSDIALNHCHWCDSTDTRINGNAWFGDHWERIYVCQACRTTRDDAGLPQRPRAPRRPRHRQPLYGDYAWVAAWNGIATDGSGRVNR